MTYSYPSSSRSSASVEAPPPTSMIRPSRPIPLARISSSENWRRGRYQLTSVGALAS
ncbi:hypothetical protein [Tautonia plasticadhaerens]|uniref:hypothetical protein n=1 Tax=Tautonia plasticadhaerens TaxID=2527974 RepID=UPI0018D23E33|nr:hypothetical protein [Tautonia plasticadhaerens]